MTISMMLNQNLMNYQSMVAQEKNVASAPLKPGTHVLDDGTTLSMGACHDKSALSPRAQAEAAKQRADVSEQRFDQAVGKLSPFHQNAATAAREECRREAARARREGRPYDEKSAYTLKMMQYSHDMLAAADSPGQMRNAMVGQGVDVRGLGEVFHSGAEYIHDRDARRQLEAKAPKKSASQVMDEYIKG